MPGGNIIIEGPLRIKLWKRIGKCTPPCKHYLNTSKTLNFLISRLFLSSYPRTELLMLYLKEHTSTLARTGSEFLEYGSQTSFTFPWRIICQESKWSIGADVWILVMSGGTVIRPYLGKMGLCVCGITLGKAASVLGCRSKIFFTTGNLAFFSK